jgi:hypothetical protein
VIAGAFDEVEGAVGGASASALWITRVTTLRGQGPDENGGPKFADNLERGGHARRPAVEVSPRTSSTGDSSTWIHE